MRRNNAVPHLTKNSTTDFALKPTKRLDVLCCQPHKFDIQHTETNFDDLMMKLFDTVILLAACAHVAAQTYGLCCTRKDCEGCTLGQVEQSVCDKCVYKSWKPDGECVSFNWFKEWPEICNDPHIQTWDGTWYDYHGECDLVLMQAQALDMDIHVRTKIRYNYSFISSAAMRIGNDILEVAGWGEYFFNGVLGAELPPKIFGYDLSHERVDAKRHVFEIRMNEDETIVLKTFKDWVSVKIGSKSQEHFGDSVGLLGSFEDGALLARDGETVIVDHNAFGQEWQVLNTEPKLFQTLRTPQHPEATCILPDSSAVSARRRLGQTMAFEAAEKACAFWEDTKRRENCVYDVMASGDLENAQSGAF